MKLYFASALATALLFSQSLFSQDLSITGKVVTPDGKQYKAVDHISITLLTKDSVNMGGTFSQENGSFKIQKIKPGNYLLLFSGIGFSGEKIAINNLKSTTDMGEVVLLPHAKELQEVKISTSNVIEKIDRTLYMPDESQMKKSADAFDLIRLMQIPRLYVNPAMKSITAVGDQGVQIRINGLKVSSTELAAISPKDVKRIEYIENPGNRYGDLSLGGIINVVMKQRKDGGQLSMQLSDSPNVFWGENFLSGSYNKKRSQWSLGFTNINRGYRRSYVDIFENYQTENNNIQRKQYGIAAKTKSSDNDISLTFNNMVSDKYNFNAVLKSSIGLIPYSYRFNDMFTNGATIPVSASRYANGNSFSHSLDLALIKTLKKNRSLELNLVGTYLNTKSEKQYKESVVPDKIITDLINNISGNRYSLIGEGIFDKTFKKVKLSFGLRMLQGNSNNRYSGTINTVSNMRQSETRAFTELQGKWKKLGYIVGAGLTHSSFSQQEQNKSYYNFTPTLRLNYPVNKYSSLRYTFNVQPSVPSLSSLTAVTLPTDTIQITRGNPHLRPAANYKNSLTYSYQKDKFSMSLYNEFYYSHRPVMEEIFADGNHIVFTEANQRYLKRYNANLWMGQRNIDIGKLKKFFGYTLVLGYDNFVSAGNNYLHRLNAFYGTLDIEFSYKKLFGGIELRKFKSNLYGETWRKPDYSHILFIGYNHSQFYLGGMIMNPLSKNVVNSIERLSKVANTTYNYYYPQFPRMITMRFVYRLQFGKQYTQAKRRLHNEDKETGVLKVN